MCVKCALRPVAWYTFTLHAQDDFIRTIFFVRSRLQIWRLSSVSFDIFWVCERAYCEVRVLMDLGWHRYLYFTVISSNNTTKYTKYKSNTAISLHRRAITVLFFILYCLPISGNCQFCNVNVFLVIICSLFRIVYLLWILPILQCKCVCCEHFMGCWCCEMLQLTFWLKVITTGVFTWFDQTLLHCWSFIPTCTLTLSMRQAWADDSSKMSQHFQKYPISLLYLDSPWKMHSNKA